MDPLTHALVGASASRLALHRPLGGAAWLPGAVGALAPDLDALIRSSADPLLYAEYHRHFTHALLFIPVGGIVAALPWLWSARTKPHWLAYAAATTVGYATHGVLDASTTYGTSLWWPFADTRVAWNIVSIVDPLFTVTLLAGAAVAWWRRRLAPAAIALALCAAYLGVGFVQRDRALAAQEQLAASRGHEPVRAAVFPAFATNLVWRSLYESDGALYSDRIRVPWFDGAQAKAGYTMQPAGDATSVATGANSARIARDVVRFRRFANDWVARVPGRPDLLGDARYSESADAFEPVWSIRLSPDSDARPVDWVDRSAQRRIDPRQLWDELRGRDEAYRPM